MYHAIYESILEGDAPGTISSVKQALGEGKDPSGILNQGMIAAMAEVGRRFEAQEYFIPEMLISARAMKDGLEILRPRLVETGIEPVGKVVMGTVKGDLHDIGKNLVGMMLEGAGFEVLDLGTDVAPERFVAAVETHRPDFVGMSALLTTTMPGIANAITALQDAGVRHKVRVMIGGAPVNQEFAEKVGADLYAPEAASAAKWAKELLAKP